MDNTSLYFTKRQKSGKWRLYVITQQALICWRGSNDKITVIRDDVTGNILNFASNDEAKAYCKSRFSCTALEESEVDT